MDFSQLNYFRAAARHGNLTHAAEELYISQPGLSRYLSRLEEDLGVPLFERRKGKITLNTYGQLFLANVNLAFDQLEQGVAAVRQMYSKDQNVLSLACSIEDFLIDRLKEFSPRHPEIGIRQYTGSEAVIEAKLLQRSLDLAICAHPLQNTAIRYERLSHCPYVMICHRENPLASGGGVHLSQAADQVFICESSRLDRRRLTSLCAASGFQPRISHEIENGYILFNLLQENNGVALVPLAYYLKIESQFPGHQLRALKILDEQALISEIGVAYLPEQNESNSTAAFLAYLRTWAKQEAQTMACFLPNSGPL